MPFTPGDQLVARKVAKEARKFADLMLQIPVERGWRNHPAIRPMLRSFLAINKSLATRDRAGSVSLAAQRRIGREFAKIGTALAAGARSRAGDARRSAATRRKRRRSAR